MACRLSSLFRNLYINSRSVSTSTSQIGNQTRLLPNTLLNFLPLSNSKSPVSKDLDLKFSPRSINLEFNVPPSQISQTSILDLPISINRHIDEPLGIVYNDEETVPGKSIDLPTYGETIEKLAVRMIIIRRKKMKLHKRRKFRKKYKIFRAKLRLNRRIKKEKFFKKSIQLMVKEAQEFDAKEYVQSRLNILTQEVLPPIWRGEILPEEMIRQFRDEHRQKKLAKRNRKRLTFD